MSKYLITLLLSVVTYNILVLGLTCNQVLEFPDDKTISYNDLQTMTPKEITACLSHLGRKKTPLIEAEYIWQSIVEYHDGLENIPESVFYNLRWVTIAVKPENYVNMTLNNIDVIRNFGINYDLSDEQLAAIANRVREDFASKEPEDYTFYDLTALGQILCAFNRSEIERIHTTAYREAASVIGKLEKCNAEVMRGFAKLAVQESTFGKVENWNNSTLQLLGHVSEYLPKNITDRIKEEKGNIKQN